MNKFLTLTAIVFCVAGTSKSLGQGAEYVAVPVVQQGDPAPGIPNAQFTTIGQPALNDSGQIAFQALVSAPGIGNQNSGIWVGFAVDGSTIGQLAVQTGLAAPGTAGDIYSALSDPVFNNNNVIAFKGTLQKGVGDVGTTPIDNSVGIWTFDGFNLLLVAQQGVTPVPGFPNAVFASFTQFVLPDSGGLVLLATMAGPGIFSTNNQGIWAVDINGNLQLILCVGNQLNGKTITALSFLPSVTAEAGQTRSFAAASGSLLIKCTFSDKTWQGVKVVFP